MRIQNKLFLAFALSSSLLIAITVLLMQWSVDRGMLDYVNSRESQRWQPTVEALAEYFAQQGNWSALAGDHRQFRRIVQASRAQGDAGPPIPPGGRPGREGGRRPAEHRAPPGGSRADHLDRPSPPVLLDGASREIVGTLHRQERYLELPIVSDGERVGWLMIPAKETLTEGFELNFLQQQQETVIIICLIVLGLTLASSIPLSRQLVAPVKELARNTRLLTEGDYTQEITTKRRDELGELSRDFNQLSHILHQTDLARKRWLADTSHELRTPLAIIQGELEAMLDGVREVSIGNVRSVHQEVLRLARLVDDLRELTSADVGAMQYHMGSLDFRELVEDTAAQHLASLQQRELVVEQDLGHEPLPVWGDAARLEQLMGNVLSNNARYTTAGGTLRLSLARSARFAVLKIEDSGPGVSPQDLDKLFDYLYRTDDSRSRKTGGTGLGLAISARIAKAHDASLDATQSSLGGLCITLSLPLVT